MEAHGFDPCVNYIGVDYSPRGRWTVVLLASEHNAREPVWCRHFERLEALQMAVSELRTPLLLATAKVQDGRRWLPDPRNTLVALEPWEIQFAEEQAEHITLPFRRAYALAVTAAYRHQAPRLLQQFQHQLDELRRLVLCDEVPF